MWKKKHNLAYTELVFESSLNELKGKFIEYNIGSVWLMWLTVKKKLSPVSISCNLELLNGENLFERTAIYS